MRLQPGVAPGYSPQRQEVPQQSPRGHSLQCATGLGYTKTYSDEHPDDLRASMSRGGDGLPLDIVDGSRLPVDHPRAQGGPTDQEMSRRGNFVRPRGPSRPPSVPADVSARDVRDLGVGPGGDIMRTSPVSPRSDQDLTGTFPVPSDRGSAVSTNGSAGNGIGPRRGIPPGSPYRGHGSGGGDVGGAPGNSLVPGYRNGGFGPGGEDEDRSPGSVAYVPTTPMRRAVPPPPYGNGGFPPGVAEDDFVAGGTTPADFPPRSERLNGGVGSAGGVGLYFMHPSFSPSGRRRTRGDSGGTDVFRLDGSSRRSSVGPADGGGMGGSGGGGSALSEGGAGGGGSRVPPYVSSKLRS